MRLSIAIPGMFFSTALATHFIPKLQNFGCGVDAPHGLDAPRGLQFLYDSGHPWAVENRRKIESSPNPQYDICYGNLRPGHGEVPADLFNTIQIDNNRYGTDRGGSKNAMNRINEILQCPPALHGGRELEVDINMHTERASYQKWHVNMFGLESPAPKLEVPKLITTLLQSMPKLETIRWETHDHGTEEFASAFANLTLPSVTHLLPPKNMECMIAMCPNLTHLDLVSWPHYSLGRNKPELIDAMINEAKYARNLEHIGMDGGWTLDRLQCEYLVYIIKSFN